jgi:hypothetical protein
MLKRFLSSTVALALVVSASAAFAGTYVTGPLPTEFGGNPNKNFHLRPHVPSGATGPAILKNIQKASAEGAKLAAAVEKCYSKGASNYSANKATGLSACLNDTAKGVIPKFQAKVTAIGTKAPGYPPCNAVPAGQASVIANLVKGFNSTTYCQSPSGAFVDGAATF